MNISQRGINFIKSLEGYSASSYADSTSGRDSIGYGHQIILGESYTNIDEATAEQLLVKDLAKAVRKVNNAITQQLTQSQFDALVSFAFNTGKDSSQLYDLINTKAGDTKIYNWWTTHYLTSGGIPNKVLRDRRKAEAELYLWDEKKN